MTTANEPVRQTVPSSFPVRLESLVSDGAWDCGNGEVEINAAAVASKIATPAQTAPAPASTPDVPSSDASPVVKPANDAPEPAEKTLPVRQRIARDDRYSNSDKVIEGKMADFTDHETKFGDLLHPEKVAADLRAAMAQEHDLAVLNEQRTMLIEIESEASKVAQHRAISIMGEKLDAIKAELVKKVTIALHAVLPDLETEAEFAERALYEGFGMAREETSVTRRLHRCKTDLQAMLDGLKAPTHTAPGSLVVPSLAGVQHVLDWFKS